MAHALEGNLDALPALIAIHGEVTANNSGNLANANLLQVVDELLHVTSTRLGVGIAAVAEEVDEDLLHTICLGCAQESVQVSLLGVLSCVLVLVVASVPRDAGITHDTSVRDETAEVKTAIAIGGRLKGLLDDLILVELFLLDGLVDANNVLPHNAASANVEMADFRVAHQAFGQTDGEGRGVKLGEAGLALGELIHDRGLGRGNGIAILGALLRRDTPTVNDDCAIANNALATEVSTRKSDKFIH